MFGAVFDAIADFLVIAGGGSGGGNSNSGGGGAGGYRTSYGSTSGGGGSGAGETGNTDGNGHGGDGLSNLIAGQTQITSTATYQLNSDGSSIPSNTYPLTTRGITYAAGKFGNAAGFSGNLSLIHISEPTRPY